MVCVRHGCVRYGVDCGFRFFFSSRRRHTRFDCDWSSDVCSSDLGKPMLQWVYERACAAGALEVLIATDDERIVSAAHSFGAEAVLTARTHASGTDRDRKSVV